MDALCNDTGESVRCQRVNTFRLAGHMNLATDTMCHALCRDTFNRVLDFNRRGSNHVSARNFGAEGEVSQAGSTVILLLYGLSTHAYASPRIAFPSEKQISGLYSTGHS